MSTQTRGERMITANGVVLCVETFGDPADPTILLIHGASASMLWWDRSFCERLAAGGRHVVRYDNRDTGRSVHYPPGQPAYALSDLVGDALGVLDALDVERAHVVGRSMSGAVAITLGLEHRDRVLSLALVGTSASDDGPSSSPELDAAYATQPDDLDDDDAVVEHAVTVIRAHAGGSPYFDETSVRATARQDVVRTTSMASALTNHYVIDIDAPATGGPADLAVPTLVVHGELDPIFPLAHAKELAAQIPGATLLVLERAGHDPPAALEDVLVEAVLRSTSAA